jgi:uncharacterized damage-inducible protein DinB
MNQLSLSPFYKGWDVYQQHLVAAIAPLTAEQLALRSSPQNWSIGMIATHIVACRAWWFHTRMGEGSADLEQVFPHPDGGDRPARSRQWMIWHVLEHDIHHGGELSSILGAHGLAAVDLE